VVNPVPPPPPPPRNQDRVNNRDGGGGGEGGRDGGDGNWGNAPMHQPAANQGYCNLPTGTDGGGEGKGAAEELQEEVGQARDTLDHAGHVVTDAGSEAVTDVGSVYV